MVEPCDVCCGTGIPVSKKPCICKGTGTVIGELLGFRELVFELENEIIKLQDENEALKHKLNEEADERTKLEQTIKDVLVKLQPLRC